MSRPREILRLFQQSTSTNDTVHQAASDGAPEGTVHVARSQSSGRGRQGRVWWSPPDAGLWMTLLLRPRVSAERAPGLALIAGMAAKRALEPLLSRDLDLCWPNDLMIGQRKLAGILCELRSEGGQYWVALGMGINIDHSTCEIPPELVETVISLADLDSEEREPLGLAKRITDEFWPLYETYQAGAALPELMAGSLSHIGERVTVKVSDNQSFEGTLEGLGTEGELLVRSGDSVNRVRAGEVIYHLHPKRE